MSEMVALLSDLTGRLKRWSWSWSGEISVTGSNGQVPSMTVDRIEVVFLGCRYISPPDQPSFEDPDFREPTAEELHSVVVDLGSIDGLQVLAWDAVTHYGPRRFVVACERLDIGNPWASQDPESGDDPSGVREPRRPRPPGYPPTRQSLD
jgi:hypothetical protein